MVACLIRQEQNVCVRRVSRKIVYVFRLFCLCSQLRRRHKQKDLLEVQKKRKEKTRTHAFWNSLRPCKEVLHPIPFVLPPTHPHTRKPTKTSTPIQLIKNDYYFGKGAKKRINISVNWPNWQIKWNTRIDIPILWYLRKNPKNNLQTNIAKLISVKSSNYRKVELQMWIFFVSNVVFLFWTVFKQV